MEVVVQIDPSTIGDHFAEVCARKGQQPDVEVRLAMLGNVTSTGVLPAGLAVMAGHDGTKTVLGSSPWRDSVG